MASQIYEQAGLLISWKNCPAQPEPKLDRRIQAVDNRHLVLHMEHQARTLEIDILSEERDAVDVGHLLLGSHAHSPIGIMRPQLQAKDFWVPELGATTFSRQQTQRISDRLVRIQAERGSKSHGARLLTQCNT